MVEEGRWQGADGRREEICFTWLLTTIRALTEEAYIHIDNGPKVVKFERSN
ncbi:hypothetical protein [Nostoc sp. 106C]|uniref:hypothetical protein n=1 Tax=Nostoc sp. 106C TaxID=1932667 RepID=UPI0014128CCD|nr:hypothetical protein [Nostoc sp. 106C]